MRVLHVFKTYLPDGFAGVERVIWEIAEGSVARGIDVDVFSLSARPADGPVPVGRHLSHQAKRDAYIASTGLSFSAFGAFRGLARRADIVHYHFPWPFMDILHFAAGVDRPSVVTYHSDIVRQKSLLGLYEPLMHRFLSQADVIVATSPKYAETSRVLQRHADRVVTIPIGIGDPHPARRDDLKIGELRARLPDRFFLFVGELRYYKGVPFLLEAARQSGLPVVIAGEGELRSSIEGARLSNVHHLGKVTDEEKWALLDLATAFVFPSQLRSEAFGVALLEAAAAGKPMISCEIGTGTSYVNIDGETGFVVPPADAEALAAAMNRIWLAPEIALEMGRRARARYEDHFTADRMASEYVRLYGALRTGRNP